MAETSGRLCNEGRGGGLNMTFAAGGRAVLAATVVLAIATSVGAEPFRTRTECIALAKQKQRLEGSGVKDLLQRDPSDVVARRGRSGVDGVRQYIWLNEQLLFQCPIHILNATAAPLEERRRLRPPLPAKGPMRRVNAVPRRAIVPLPVKRSRAWRRPGSQGYQESRG